MKKLVGLVGFGGSGKDTVASFMQGYIRLAFADKVKELARTIDPFVTCHSSGVTHRVSRWIEMGASEEWLKMHTNYRDFLVRLGDGSRKVLGEYVWTEPVFRRIAHSPECSFVVTDVRYLNEAYGIVQMGGELWYVDRETAPANEIEEETIDTIVTKLSVHIEHVPNTGTLADLRERVQKLL